MKYGKWKRVFLLVTIISSLVVFSGCKNRQENSNLPLQNQYGVFLSAEKELKQFDSFETIVIDAQYFDVDEISKFKSEGHKVYSYINVGALENYRDYYSMYESLMLGYYEHWTEEIWIDVSNEKWQEFILKNLALQLKKKGIDGFFVDNCDVYYQYPSDEILTGLTVIMQGLVDTGLEVVINGGDVFLDAYCENEGSWNEVITGINQETVFSKITWNGDVFDKNSEEDREYFCGYVEKYGSLGADIYLLEYTKDQKLIKEIDVYCKEHGFKYYVSDSVELDG